LFLNNENYEFFLKKYSYYVNPIADTFAYCLMPNHFHFLVRIKEINYKTSEVLETSGVSYAFKNLFILYSKAFNKVNSRIGSLFCPKFHRKLINTEEYLKYAVNYIHQNPVYHEFVNQPKQWKYSSYRTFFSLKPTSLNKSEVLEWFENLENFTAFHKTKAAEFYASKLELEY
jgi:putative transposase